MPGYGKDILKFKAVIVTIMLSIFAAGLSAAAQSANSPNTPYTDEKPHLGVMSCYGSTCHSRQEATGVVVQQNEILIWQDETSTTGAHTRAYKTLLTERSKDIVKRLGLGPAHEAKECLSCHADGIAPALRGPKFQITDGVSCESCHGSAGDWLTQHYETGSSHSKNVGLGLYPLEDAKTRAGVCLSCHLGSSAENQFVTHRYMAAGHPRMSFELDLFTALQSHHSEDYDYFDRKRVQSGARIWATGQAMNLQAQLRLFADPALNRDGMFPELVFFDCLACHRPISDDPNWRPSARPNPGRPNTPGLVKFNDASMIMLLATANQIAPDLAGDFDRAVKNYHASLKTSGAAQNTASAKLSVLTEDLMTVINQTDFTKAQTLDILDVIVADTLTRRYTDYVAAEQAIMAVDTLLSSMIAAKQVAKADVSDMRDEINTAYDAVENPNAYDQDRLTAALRSVQTRLKDLR